MHTRSVLHIVAVTIGLLNISIVLVFSLVQLTRRDVKHDLYIGMVSTILGLSITLVVQALIEYRKVLQHIRFGRDDQDSDNLALDENGDVVRRDGDV